MIVQSVKFESSLSEEEVLAVAKERAPQFRAVPGLIQKYYLRFPTPNHYGAYYLWDSPESLAVYRDSDLAKSIPAAYAVAGAPAVEVQEVLFPLRDCARTAGRLNVALVMLFPVGFDESAVKGAQGGFAAC